MEMSSDASLAAAMPAGRLFRAYLTQAKYESIRTLLTLGFAAAVPVALYLSWDCFSGRTAATRRSWATF
jgi:hypothetical protein